MNIYDLLKVDKDHLLYLDAKDVEIKRFTFPEIGKAYQEKCSFYQIDGIDDYIIKDTTMEPLMFNRSSNRRLLKKLVDKQGSLPEIGFPIGYYRSHGLFNGTIIPYYKDSTSIRKLIYLSKFENLKEYYNHEYDEIDNLVSLCLDILELLHKMQKKNVYYVDVNTGNFLISNNEVKVIDFEPSHVFIKNKSDWYYERIIKNFLGLVEKICHKYGFGNVLLNSEDTFLDAEYRVKLLKKELRR